MNGVQIYGNILPYNDCFLISAWRSVEMFKTTIQESVF